MNSLQLGNKHSEDTCFVLINFVKTVLKNSGTEQYEILLEVSVHWLIRTQIRNTTGQYFNSIWRRSICEIKINFSRHDYFLYNKITIRTMILFSMLNLLWPVNVIPMCLRTKCKNFLCDSHNFPVLFTAPIKSNSSNNESGRYGNDKQYFYLWFFFSSRYLCVRARCVMQSWTTWLFNN